MQISYEMVSNVRQLTVPLKISNQIEIQLNFYYQLGCSVLQEMIGSRSEICYVDNALKLFSSSSEAILSTYDNLFHMHIPAAFVFQWAGRSTETIHWHSDYAYSWGESK